MSPYQDKIETQQWQADKLEYCFQMLLITKGQVLYSFLSVHAYMLGSLTVSGWLATYPFPKLKFCPKWEVSVNVDLGEG